MTSEEYGQYIDDFELGADVMPGESLTDYIERRRREFDSKADGGAIGIEVLFTDKKPRKNFFMGGPALEGQALDIYNSMNPYGFSDQEIADALSARGLYTPGGSTPTPEVTQPNIINQQIQEGGDGPQGDFGLFGDLLKDTEKDFNVQVYDEELGDFIDTTIKGYQNVKSGLYQTKEGKNVDAMFTDTPTGIFKIISNIMEPKQFGATYPIGKIQGAYTNLASLLKNQRNPTNLITQKQQRLINKGSQIAEDFTGGGEFPMEKTPKKPPTKPRRDFAFEDQSYSGGSGGSGGGGGFGAADFGNFSDKDFGAL